MPQQPYHPEDWATAMGEAVVKTLNAMPYGGGCLPSLVELRDAVTGLMSQVAHTTPYQCPYQYQKQAMLDALQRMVGAMAGLSTLLENMNEELAQAAAEVEAWKRRA
jgi:hypothetical protein